MGLEMFEACYPGHLTYELKAIGDRGSSHRADQGDKAQGQVSGAQER